MDLSWPLPRYRSEAEGLKAMSVPQIMKNNELEPTYWLITVQRRYICGESRCSAVMFTKESISDCYGHQRNNLIFSENNGATSLYAVRITEQLLGSQNNGTTP